MLVGIAIVGPPLSQAGFAERFAWMLLTALIAIVVADITNTAGLCYFLMRERSRNLVKS